MNILVVYWAGWDGSETRHVYGSCAPLTPNPLTFCRMWRLALEFSLKISTVPCILSTHYPPMEDKITHRGLGTFCLVM